MAKSKLILLSFLSFLLIVSAVSRAESINTSNDQIIVGAEQFDLYLPKLTNKRVGLVVNQTSRVYDQHLVDSLLKQGVNIVTIFAPEHGFRGNHGAGEIVSSSIDQETGLTIVSIYGKNKKPSANVLQNIDIIIFDIQDVGVRFYTYLSSMHYVMQAAAEHDKQVIILDRPNPNIAFVDGPILQPEFRSFVGLHPIPILHGMTLGELSQMILGESWLSINSTLPKSQFDIYQSIDITVIPVKNYDRSMQYTLPIPPSPNLPNQQAIRLYPSLCFFEATPISIGRGTSLPFQVIGHDKLHIGEFRFTPIAMPFAAPSPKLENKPLLGTNLSNSSTVGLDLTYLHQWFVLFQSNNMKFFTRPNFMDKLAGTDAIRKLIQAGLSPTEIQKTWEKEIQQFKQQRLPYLLYK